MQEPSPRLPSITGRTMTSDGSTYESRAGRSEGRGQRTKIRPLYLAQVCSPYGESQFAWEIEEREDYHTEHSYSTRAPSSRRDREHRRQLRYAHEQDRHYAEARRCRRGFCESLHNVNPCPSLICSRGKKSTGLSLGSTPMLSSTI